VKTHFILWAAAGAAATVLFACSTTTTVDGSPAAGPPIAAGLVGGACSGVGTSPGDSAVFAQTDCPAGLCLADARTGFDTYCTADCASQTCPSGFACVAVTLGDKKNVCMKDGTAVAAGDGGTDAASSTDSAAAGPLGTKTDKGVKSVDVNISSKTSFTCTDACKTAGGACDAQSNNGNGLGWIDRKYNDGSGTTGNQIDSCDEEQDYYSGNTTLTDMSCFCDGMKLPTTVKVTKAQGLASCAAVCTSWSLTCSKTRESDAYLDPQGNNQAALLCADVPSATTDHVVCACDP
jgi:hypothetical protein